MQFGVPIKNKCPGKKLMSRQTKRSILQTEICKICKQQLNCVKFGIIIHAHMYKIHLPNLGFIASIECYLQSIIPGTSFIQIPINRTLLDNQKIFDWCM